MDTGTYVWDLQSLTENVVFRYFGHRPVQVEEPFNFSMESELELQESPPSSRRFWKGPYTPTLSVYSFLSILYSAACSPLALQCTRAKNMRESKKENKFCDICGVSGYRESLAACFRCKRACEHIYCMRTNLKCVPEIWYCEACRLQKKSNSEARRDPAKISSPWQKSIAPVLRNSHLKGVETGKVKCISPEEAIMLTSGTKRKAVICSTSQSGPTDSMTSTYRRRNPPVSTSHLSKCFVQKQNANPKKIAVRTQPPHGDRIPDDKPSLGEKLKLSKVEGGASDVDQKSQIKLHKPVHLDGGASLMEEDRENLPALDCTWKGSFEILDMYSCSHFYDGFQAHPPGKVSRKAYEFSKKMSGILQFKLENNSDVWAKVFDSYSPAGSDIALYFFPGDFERSVKVYEDLYSYLEKHDFAMRSCLEGVELLIFTSKQLPLDSRINMELYLWGVFHHVKGNNVLHPADVPSSSSQLLPADLHRCDARPVKYEHKDNLAVVDTDIDMVGTKDVGRVDVVRQVVREARQWGSFGTPQGLPQLKSGNHQFLDAPPGFSRPVIREASCERSFSNSLKKVDSVDLDLISTTQPQKKAQKNVQAPPKHCQVFNPSCTMDSTTTEFTRSSEKQKRPEQSESPVLPINQEDYHQRHRDGGKTRSPSHKSRVWDDSEMKAMGKGVKIQSLDEIHKAAKTASFTSQELTKSPGGDSGFRNQCRPLIPMDVKKEDETQERETYELGIKLGWYSSRKSATNLYPSRSPPSEQQQRPDQTENFVLTPSSSHKSRVCDNSTIGKGVKIRSQEETEMAAPGGGFRFKDVKKEKEEEAVAREHQTNELGIKLGWFGKKSQ
ncbi:uncharacterized protein LOC122075876 isoform X2 [Macadamia integrifolia]|uniref:uncharacterized protein LOC122075876 isoform X2 n=1 Tax=Macadamia integrifolia TaxID=60698 RepID=UPI001C4F2BB1|nr:uncharacterized protein LOC122075876 isoform X2 [Macadamia integrifolia]